MEENELSKFIDEFDAVTKKPEKFLSLQSNEAELIKSLTKNLYRFSKVKEFPVGKHSDALSELATQYLDEEQIWQQIELQNNVILNRLLSKVAHLLAKKNQLNFPLKKNKEQKDKGNKQKHSKTNGIGEDKLSDSESFGNNETKKGSKEKLPVKKKTGKPSVVDDKFFKLYEMEEFLEKMEKGNKSKDKNKDNDNDGEDDDDDDDEDIDYFMDEPSDSNADSDDAEKLPKYSDFFDEPEDEAIVGQSKRKTSKSSEEGSNNKKKVKFALDDDGNDSMASSVDTDLFSAVTEEKEVNNSEDDGSEDAIYDKQSGFDENDDDDDDDDGDDKPGIDVNEPPSAFEARQERLKTRINKLEESALNEKPWQMKGEVTAASRPQNSLLQEYVEFDVATRPAPVLTEKSTLRLEDIIRQRIKDKAWDDVVRKIKPVDSDIEYKKKLVLDQEKSKLSLAQIYEQEYLKQAENKATENLMDKPEIEPPEHQEIKGLLKNLFRKLDALSNFHFTPKPVSAEVKIISNAPAITMEEVLPVAMSDATLLAPEEVKSRHKGELIGKSERTATDKKRERRQKKVKQRLKFKKIEKKAKEKLENSNGKSIQGKNFSNKLLQKITKSSNVTSLKETGGKYIKSSTSFFSKLQDETNAQIKRKTLELGKPKTFTKRSEGKKH